MKGSLSLSLSLSLSSSAGHEGRMPSARQVRPSRRSPAVCPKRTLPIRPTEVTAIFLLSLSLSLLFFYGPYVLYKWKTRRRVSY